MSILTDQIAADIYVYFIATIPALERGFSSSAIFITWPQTLPLVSQLLVALALQPNPRLRVFYKEKDVSVKLIGTINSM